VGGRLANSSFLTTSNISCFSSIVNLFLGSGRETTIKITDIERMAKAAHDVGAIIVVDNTFATPINQNPLKLGADLVLHSATKFLGGHADALGGVLCGRKQLVEQVYHYREINGATMDPMAAYLLLRGMKTLKLRVNQQSASALTIANYLKTQDFVEAVY
jgi:cystathionine gamma-synthase